MNYSGNWVWGSEVTLEELITASREGRILYNCPMISSSIYLLDDYNKAIEDFYKLIERVCIALPEETEVKNAKQST